MTAEASIKEFWDLVQVCLVELYGMPGEKAAKAVQKLWSRGADGRRAVPSTRSSVYHAAPIHVAMNIAGDEFLTDALWERYRRLVERYECARKTSGAAAGGAAAGSARAVRPVRRVRQGAAQKAFAAR
jgi:hypothetical protein